MSIMKAQPKEDVEGCITSSEGYMALKVRSQRHDGMVSHVDI
jgi:hypothetical protein